MKKIISIILLFSVMGVGLLFLQEKQKANQGGKGQTVYSMAGLPPQPLDKRNYNNGALTFSPDGKYLAAASEKGEVQIIEVESKKIIYKRKFGIGFLRSMAFSPDSKRIYLGETSPEGKVYCVSLPEGRMLWQASLGKDIGNNLSLESYPVIYRLLPKENGLLYCLVGRGEHRGGKVYYYQTRLYALNAQSGQEIWKFPENENLQAKSNWLDSDNQGKIVVFSGSGKLYCLNGQTGKQSWNYNPTPTPPFQEISSWFSPSVSPDGRYIAFFTGEGMVYFFNQEGRMLWKKQISIPKEANGIPLYAVGLRSYFQQNKLILLTGNSYKAADSGSKIFLEHPNDHSIFAYDFSGNLYWKWKGGGYISDVRFTADGKSLICPVSKNFRTQDFSQHGAYLLDLSQEDKGEVYLEKGFQAKTLGPIVSADISPTGQYVAAWETAVQMPDGIEIRGKYQIHLWKRGGE